METTRDRATPETDDDAFIVHTDLRVVRASGADARRWLHDLVTADVASLEPHQARRTLLLTPTGRIRADLHLLALQDGAFLVAQRIDRSEDVEAILAPYRLSASVELEPVRTTLVSVRAVSDVLDRRPWRPSLLGEGWSDIAIDEDVLAIRARLLAAGMLERSPEMIERERILRGVARFGRDFGTDSLPAEAGLDGLIDREKGCFLGQESVAKVRNLGHPPRVLLHLWSSGEVGAGTEVRSGGRSVGEVTSATPALDDRGTTMIARVRWEEAAAALELPDGMPLLVVA